MGNWVFKKLYLWKFLFSVEKVELRLVEWPKFCSLIINVRILPCVYIAPVS